MRKLYLMVKFNFLLAKLRSETNFNDENVFVITCIIIKICEFENKSILSFDTKNKENFHIIKLKLNNFYETDFKKP